MAVFPPVFPGSDYDGRQPREQCRRYARHSLPIDPARPSATRPSGPVIASLDEDFGGGRGGSPAPRPRVARGVWGEGGGHAPGTLRLRGLYSVQFVMVLFFNIMI